MFSPGHAAGQPGHSQRVWGRFRKAAVDFWPANNDFMPDFQTPLVNRRIVAIRRPMRPVAPQKDGPRSNEDIVSPDVQLIDAEGENKGIVRTRDAIAMAQELGLDLVEISPNAAPPVAKMLDLGRFKYAAQKKAAEARKKQKVIEVKEIQLRPNIDTHDFDTKMKAVTKFLGEGDRVKVTMRFRGREMAHQELGMQLLIKVRDMMENEAKVESSPRSEGRQMVMVLAPK
jgi:translation initiation factor IF-3